MINKSMNETFCPCMQVWFLAIRGWCAPSIGRYDHRLFLGPWMYCNLLIATGLPVLVSTPSTIQPNTPAPFFGTTEEDFGSFVGQFSCLLIDTSIIDTISFSTVMEYLWPEQGPSKGATDSRRDMTMFKLFRKKCRTFWLTYYCQISKDVSD